MKGRSVSVLGRSALLLMLFAIISGCGLVDENITLRPVSRVSASTIGQGQRVAVTVLDERPSTMLGLRGPEGMAEIHAAQNVGRVVGDAINRGLETKGFVPVTTDTGEEPVTMEVQIRALEYDSAAGLFAGTSYATAALKVEARNGDENFGQIYRSQSEEHSILIPMESEDSEQINEALSSAINQIFYDQALLDFLAAGAPPQAPAAPGQ